MPHECTECGRAFEDGSKEMLSGCPDCGGTTFQFRPEGNDSPEGDPDGPPEPDVDGMARTVGNAASAVRNLVTGGRGPHGGPSAGAESEEPAGVSADDSTTSGGPATADGPSDTAPATADGLTGGTSDGPADSAGPDGPTGREWPGSDDPETDDGQHVTTTRPEGGAQSDARGDIVEADELPTADRPRDRPPVPDPRPLSARPGEESGGDASTAEGGEDLPAAGTVGAEDPEERPSLSELRSELNDQFESIRVVEPGQYELNLMELYDREEYIIALQEDGKYTVQLPERWDER